MAEDKYEKKISKPLFDFWRKEKLRINFYRH